MFSLHYTFISTIPSLILSEVMRAFYSATQNLVISARIKSTELNVDADWTGVEISQREKINL